MLPQEIAALMTRKKMITLYNSIKNMALNGSQRYNDITLKDLELHLSVLGKEMTGKNFKIYFGRNLSEYLKDVKSKVELIRDQPSLGLSKLITDSDKKIDELYGLKII